MAKYLLPLVPPHHCYVEPFCGALGLFLAKPISKREVINDSNQDIANLFRQVKFHPEELTRELDWRLNARADFNYFILHPGATEIQRAAAFLIKCKMEFHQGSNSFAVGRREGGAPNSSLVAKIESIRALHRRLDKVVIECQDWKRVVKNHDAPETFFFFDPPYTGCDADAYSAWTEAQVAELAEVIFKLRGRWLLTLNDTPANRKLFAAAKIKRLTRPRGIANKKANERKTYAELVIQPATCNLQPAT